MKLPCKEQEMKYPPFPTAVQSIERFDLVVSQREIEQINVGFDSIGWRAFWDYYHVLLDQMPQ